LNAVINLTALADILFQIFEKKLHELESGEHFISGYQKQKNMKREKYFSAVLQILGT
jgi:hypothetical protein